jgi:DnaJ-class molecular chaperone
MQDWYAVLYVTRDAPHEVVRAAYRVLSQRWHPDRNLDDPTAIGRMMEINQAYDVLSEPDARADYDRRWVAAVQQQSQTVEPSFTVSTTPASPATARTKFDPERSNQIQRQVRFWIMVLATVALLALWLLGGAATNSVP